MVQLETGEMMVWKGRPAYHLRYPFLAVVFFALIFTIDLGPVGQAVGVLSVFLWILFMIVTVVSLVLDDRSKYFLTSSRIISRKSTLLVSDVINIRVEQSWLGRLRGTGNVYFNSKNGRWTVFRHVKNPEELRQSGVNLTGAPAESKTALFCKYCGARVPVGSAKCSTCGADI